MVRKRKKKNLAHLVSAAIIIFFFYLDIKTLVTGSGREPVVVVQVTRGCRSTRIPRLPVGSCGGGNPVVVMVTIGRWQQQSFLNAISLKCLDGGDHWSSGENKGEIKQNTIIIIIIIQNKLWKININTRPSVSVVLRFDVWRGEITDSRSVDVLIPGPQNIEKNKIHFKIIVKNILPIDTVGNFFFFFIFNFILSCSRVR